MGRFLTSTTFECWLVPSSVCCQIKENIWIREKWREKPQYLDFSTWVRPGHMTMFPENTSLPWKITALGIIFHSKVCVTMDEKLTYHKSRIIFFQTNAWINKDVCKRWIDTTLSTDEFKEKISAIKGLWIMLVWFERGNWSVAANGRWMYRCPKEIIQYPVKGVVSEGWECRSLLQCKEF